jgi:tetrahydromethanopterin S-methyltransferase subunit B
MDSPQQIIDKLNTYTEKFYSALDDYSNSYINYKLYPGYIENENIYANNKAILESLQADVFIKTNDVQQNINTLNSLIADLNAKLSPEKTKNTNLKAQLSQLTSSSSGADLLIGETSEMYKIQWLSNITMFIGIFLVLITLFKVYVKPPQMQLQMQRQTAV